MSKRSRCVFCSSTAYGPGCPFSPHKIHFHASDPTRCCYCGSVAQGPGCPFNPHGKMHIRGVEFNSMIRETIDKGITMGYLRSILSTNVTEMAAYKLGIIDKTGKRIKTPETVEEQNAYGPLEEYVLAIKNLTGTHLELVDKSIDIKLESVISRESYGKALENISDIKRILSEAGTLYKEAVVTAYNAGLSTAAIEKLIVDSIIEAK